MVPAPRRPTLDPDEDARLVAGCLKGDARAWEALVRRHERLVYAVTRSYRLSDADVGDVFQEVFAALVKGLPSLRDPRSLVRWLSSTADRIARATALRRRRDQALHTTDEVALGSLSADEPPVGADLERLEYQAQVRLAFSALGERCRELLGALYYRDEPATYSQLSRRLGMPMNSVGPNRARCLDRLRSLVESVTSEPGTNRRPPTTSGSRTSRPRTLHRSRTRERGARGMVEQEKGR